MTLEEAQARIVELTEENQRLQNDNETLSQNNNTLSEEIEKVRTINQDYFNRLMQQNASDTDDGDEDDTVPTCEEFASSLNI